MTAWGLRAARTPAGLQLHLDGVTVDVVLKGIRNLHLSVHPPDGRVRISAPSRMPIEDIRRFAASRLGWIREHQRRIRAQERETPGNYLHGESHHVWGRRLVLAVSDGDLPPSVGLDRDALLLRVRPGTDARGRRAVVEEWLRGQVRQAAEGLIVRWGPAMGVEVRKVFVRRMKTKWGSCNPRRRTIRLNTSLACKPPECLEYILVHELVHLLEPSHNARFVALMDRFLPPWRSRREQLNRLPVRHEDWPY